MITNNYKDSYKGVVTYERPDGSKTVSECKFDAEWLCMNWVFDQITNVHKYGAYSTLPDSIIGEIISRNEHIVYTMNYDRRNDNTDVIVNHTPVKPKKQTNTNRSKMVFMFWNKDTRSILGTYSTSIAAELERTGWVKLKNSTPNIGTKYFNRCKNWFIATMSDNGNYNMTKVEYKHPSNNPDDFKNYIRPLL